MADGVAAGFYYRVERKRVDLGWSKDHLSGETARHTADGRPIPRSTIENLRTSSRAPQPRIVHALADAVGVARDEAYELAGLIPASPRPGQLSAREAIMADPRLTPGQKALLIGTLDQFEAANRPAPGADVGRSDDAQKAV